MQSFLFLIIIICISYLRMVTSITPSKMTMSKTHTIPNPNCSLLHAHCILSVQLCPHKVSCICFLSLAWKKNLLQRKKDGCNKIPSLYSLSPYFVFYPARIKYSFFFSPSFFVAQNVLLLSRLLHQIWTLRWPLHGPLFFLPGSRFAQFSWKDVFRQTLFYLNLIFIGDVGLWSNTCLGTSRIELKCDCLV